MPKITRAKALLHPNVEVRYQNPLVRGRGKHRFTVGTITLRAGNVAVVIHSIPGVAHALKVTAPRVHRLIAENRLKAYRFCRDLLVLDQDLQAFRRQEGAKLRRRFGVYFRP